MNYGVSTSRVHVLAGKAVAAESDSEDEDDDDSSNDGSPAKSRPLTAPANMGGPLSGGLTIPATMNDPGEPAFPVLPLLGARTIEGCRGVRGCSPKHKF